MLALIRSIARMTADVHLPALELSEGGAAELTGVWFFASVCHSVFPQTLAPQKGFRAEVAFVRLLVGVQQHVVRVARLRHRGLATDLADKVLTFAPLLGGVN